MRHTRGMPFDPLAIDPSRGRIDAAMLDLDGTLVDTLDDFVAALNLTLAEFMPGREAPRVDRATVERFVGKGSAHLLRSVLNLPKAIGSRVAVAQVPGHLRTPPLLAAGDRGADRSVAGLERSRRLL